MKRMKEIQVPTTPALNRVIAGFSITHGKKFMSSSSSSDSEASSSGSASPPPPAQKRKIEDISDDSEDDSSSSDSESQASEQPQLKDEDEPVLSHAAQRRQKKAAAKLASKKDESTPSKKRKLSESTLTQAPVPVSKRQNSIWVGNLSYKTTAADLKKFFTDGGVGEVMRLYMPTKPPLNPSMKPENRGFAYVDFATEEGKKNAIAMSEQPLTGRKLLIKDGDDFTGRPAPIKTEESSSVDPSSLPASSVTHSKTAQKILKLQKQPPAPTLFIGNLGFETVEGDIRELFEAHRGKAGKGKGKAEEGEKEVEGEGEGEKKVKKDVWIRKIRMGTFEDSGKCKGWAFADFTSTEDATSVLVNPKNHYLNGRKLNIEYASPDAVRRGQPKDHSAATNTNTNTHNGRREGGPRGMGQRRDQPTRDFNPSDREPRQKREPRPEGRQFRANEDAMEVDQAEVEENDRGGFEGRKPGGFRGGRGGGGGGGRGMRRPKPGAALASATRQSAAIVESRGKKITF